MKSPSLSVILPNYNHGHMLGEMLEGIVSQSILPQEVILVDDGSTDNSIEVIESYIQRAPFIKLYKNEINKGVLFSVNFAIQQASSDYLVFLSADDKIYSKFFEKSLAIISDFPMAGVCCSDPAYFGSKEYAEHLGWSKNPHYFPPEEFVEVINGDYIRGHTSLVSRKAILEVGGQLPELRWHCDWFALHVIAARYGVCYIPEPLALMRVGQETYSMSGRNDSDQQREVLTQLLRLLLSSKFNDVLPFFQKGKLMAHFGPEIVTLVIYSKEFWRKEVLDLIYSWIE